MKMPISPQLHGILDHGLVLGLLTVPPALKMNKKAVRIYRALGSVLGAYNASSDTGVGASSAIPFEKHYKIDYVNLAAIGALTALEPIRKEKRALIFQVAFLALSAATVVLTDKNGGKRKKD